jgi:hypothetical protein
MILTLASLSLLAAPIAEPGIRIETDAERSRYRMVIQTPRPLSFEAYRLDKPSGSLSPGFIAIEVKDRAGKLILCPGNGPDDSRYQSAAISSTIMGIEKHPPMVNVRSTFATEWYASAALFAGFELCADQHRTQWSGYRIHVDLPTSIGTLSTRSDWIAVRAPVF